MSFVDPDQARPQRRRIGQYRKFGRLDYVGRYQTESINLAQLRARSVEAEICPMNAHRLVDLMKRIAQ